MGKRGPNKGEGGRPKGSKNKVQALLKDAILQAAELAGGVNGLIGYLHAQAKENPGPFLALLGKVLPLTIAGDPNNPLVVVEKIERALLQADAWDHVTDIDPSSIRAVN